MGTVQRYPATRMGRPLLGRVGRVSEPATESTAGSPPARTLAGRFIRPQRSTLVDTAVFALAWLYGSIRVFRYGLGFDDVAYATPAQQVTLDAWRHGRMAL